MTRMSERTAEEIEEEMYWLTLLYGNGKNEPRGVLCYKSDKNYPAKLRVGFVDMCQRAKHRKKCKVCQNNA